MNSALTVVFCGLCICGVCAATEAETYPAFICGVGELEKTECMDISECEPITRLFEESKKSHTTTQQLTFYKKVQQLKCNSGNTKPAKKVCCPIKRSKSATCGKMIEDKMLIDGGKADPLGHEWLAFLEYGTPYDLSIRCGGVLISDRHVLTAASCLDSDHKLLSVRLGEFHIKTDTDLIDENVYLPKYVSVRVAKTKAHEKYSFIRRDFVEDRDDIAILTLARSVSTQPICLPTHDLNTNDTIYAVGWGIQKHDIKEKFQTKSQVRMKNTECDKHAESTICVKRLSGDDSYSCVSDQGGPLVQRARGGDKSYVVAGIAFPNYLSCEVEPKTYTDVYKYKDWIIKNMN